MRLFAAAVGRVSTQPLRTILFALLVLAWFVPWVSVGIFVTVALIGIIPDRRISRTFDSV